MDEWLLRWPERGWQGQVEVYHDHHWVATFKFESDAREWIRTQGGEASN